MLKLFKITLLIYFIYFSFTFTSFSYSGNEVKKETIRELKNNLDDLNNKSNDLKTQVNKIIKNSGGLKDFFRDNLNQKELSDLKEIFALYKIYSSRINKKIDANIKKLKNTEKSKKDLLKEKAGVYKRLSHYIKLEKRNEFLEFIKSDLTTTKEKKDIEEDLYINNDALTKKVAIIKEKIVEHKKALDEKLEKIIIEKVNEKLLKLRNSPSFNKLSYEQKKVALKKSIEKINEKIIDLKNNLNNLNNKKVELYVIVKYKLEELINSL